MVIAVVSSERRMTLKPIRIFTTRYCGFCIAAKRLLKGRDLEFEEIDVQGDTAAREWLRRTTGQHTVPQIFIGDESIGGYRELNLLDRSGRLQDLLQSSA